MSIPVTTYSMITNLVDGGDPVVAGTLYKFNLDMMTGTATVGGELPLSTDNKVTFVTNNLTCAIGTYTFEESYREVIKMESMKAGTASNKEDLINFKYCNSAILRSLRISLRKSRVFLSSHIPLTCVML